MSLSLIERLFGPPRPGLAIRQYRSLASDYDSTCTRIEKLRIQALRELQLKSGETVFDIACGTGAMLPLLSGAVGPSGRVVGVDVSPEMVAEARRRVAGMRGAADITIVESPVEMFTPNGCADALLLCYTHDVLQSPQALDRMLSVSKPGTRSVIVGLKTWPWLWGWPLNIVNMYRGRSYLTTYANLDCPWRLLSERGARLREVHTALWGTAYIAVGTLRPTSP